MALFARKDRGGPGRPKITFWKPFQPFPDLAHAREAARGGAAVAWLIAFSYVLLTALSLAGFKLLPELFETTDPGADTWANGVSIVLAVAAAGLAVIIQQRQPLWAVLVAAAWGAVEIVFKLLLIAQAAESGGSGGGVIGPMFMLVIMVLLLILAVRGAMAMRRMQGAP